MDLISLMKRALVALFVLLFCCTESVCAGAIEKAVEESGGQTHASSIYKVALTWYNGGKSSKADALQVLHHLADTGNHVMSSVKLGHHYAESGNRSSAIQYFAKAGE